MEFIRGKKTYIVAMLMVAVSLVRLLSGDIGFAEFLASDDVKLLLEGIGFGALRAGIAKK